MNIKGTLIEILPTKIVSDKFKTREIWVETTEGQYPQTISLQLTQDKCDTFPHQVGAQVDLKINIEGRKWTNPQGEEKVFNTLKCWGWNETQQAQPQAQAAPQAGVVDDDLPF